MGRGWNGFFCGVFCSIGILAARSRSSRLEARRQAVASLSLLSSLRPCDYKVNDVICEVKMAAEGVAKGMKEEEDKVDNAEDMDVDSVDEKSEAE